MNFSSLEGVLKPTSYQIVGEQQQQYSNILHQVGEKTQAYRATAAATIAIATATATTTTATTTTTTTTATATHSIIEYETKYAMAQCEVK